MDRYRTYRGKSGASHRRRSSTAAYSGNKPSKRLVKLLVCVALFVAAAVMKLVFPSVFQTVGDKLNSVVNYRAALTSLGEGISGEKKFISALGEAFTYAFTGVSTDGAAVTPPDKAAGVSADGAAVTSPEEPSQQPGSAVGSAPTAPAETDKGADAPTEEKTVETFLQSDSAAPEEETAAAAPSDGESDFSDAVIAAFLNNQQQYADYDVPAGVSYSAPALGVSFVKPVEGVVTASFGYGLRPTDQKTVFHYGTDIAAKTGTPVVAFSDGKVISAGSSNALGNYILISKGGVETQYAHCDRLLVEEGQAVKSGDKIATVGSTGSAASSGLHLELRVNGIYVNPEFYVQWT